MGGKEPARVFLVGAVEVERYKCIVCELVLEGDRYVCRGKVEVLPAWLLVLYVGGL